MAICTDCSQEMTVAIGCDPQRASHVMFMRDLKIMPRVKGVPKVKSGRCDCGSQLEFKPLHHFGCDMERCPRCKGQMISCQCGDRVVGSLWDLRYKAQQIIQQKQQFNQDHQPRYNTRGEAKRWLPSGWVIIQIGDKYSFRPKNLHSDLGGPFR
jgi:hypothetical protein